MTRCEARSGVSYQAHHGRLHSQEPQVNADPATARSPRALGAVGDQEQGRGSVGKLPFDHGRPPEPRGTVLADSVADRLQRQADITGRCRGSRWKGRDSNPRPRHCESTNWGKVSSRFNNLPGGARCNLARRSTTERISFPQIYRTIPERHTTSMDMASAGESAYVGAASGTCLCTRYIRANVTSVIAITT